MGVGTGPRRHAVLEAMNRAPMSAVWFPLRLVNSSISIWIFHRDPCYLCEHVFGLMTASCKQFSGETKDFAAEQRRNQQDGVWFEALERVSSRVLWSVQG